MDKIMQDQKNEEIYLNLCERLTKSEMASFNCQLKSN